MDQVMLYEPQGIFPGCRLLDIHDERHRAANRLYRRGAGRAPSRWGLAAAVSGQDTRGRDRKGIASVAL